MARQKESRSGINVNYEYMEMNILTLVELLIYTLRQKFTIVIISLLLELSYIISYQLYLLHADVRCKEMITLINIEPETESISVHR